MATPSPPIRPSPSSSVESEKKWAIVVEAPHVCVWPEYADRNCDMRTDDFARRLHAQLRELQKENDFDLFLLESDQPRSVCDHNRPQCANEPYRRRLREIVKRYAPNVFVADVHSFEKDYDWNRDQRRGRYLPLQDRPDIVLLDSDASPANAETTAMDYTQRMARDLRENVFVWRASEHVQRLKRIGLFSAQPQRSGEEVVDIHVERSAPLVHVIAGSKQNAIMVETRERHGAKAILIEFSEALTGPSLDAIIAQLAKSIVEEIKRL